MQCICLDKVIELSAKFEPGVKPNSLYDSVCNAVRLNGGFGGRDWLLFQSSNSFSAFQIFKILKFNIISKYLFHYFNSRV